MKDKKEFSLENLDEKEIKKGKVHFSLISALVVSLIAAALVAGNLNMAAKLAEKIVWSSVFSIAGIGAIANEYFANYRKYFVNKKYEKKYEQSYKQMLEPQIEKLNELENKITPLIKKFRNATTELSLNKKKAFELAMAYSSLLEAYKNSTLKKDNAKYFFDKFTTEKELSFQYFVAGFAEEWGIKDGEYEHDVKTKADALYDNFKLTSLEENIKVVENLYSKLHIISKAQSNAVVSSYEKVETKALNKENSSKLEEQTDLEK